MALTDRSGQSMINAYCLALGISTPTSTERATALAELKEAASEVYRGVYLDERGIRRHHLFSFLHPTSAELSVSAQGNASLTSQDIVFTAENDEAEGEEVAVVIAAGSGALVVAEDTDTSIITITLAVGGNTTAEVVAACSALTLATVTGGSATAATALAHTHLALEISGTAMPTGFSGLVEEVRYGYDGQDSKSGQRIEQVSPEIMDLKIRDWDGSNDDPQYFCLRPKALSASTGTLYEAVVFPPPGSALTLYLRYKPLADALTDSASAYAAGNDGIEQVIVAFARKNKELLGGQVEGPEARRAIRLMADAVLEDEQLFPVESYQQSYAEEGNCGLSI